MEAADLKIGKKILGKTTCVGIKFNCTVSRGAISIGNPKIRLYRFHVSQDLLLVEALFKSKADISIRAF